jgi:GNAT superfamily N-acetyltransferase
MPITIQSPALGMASRCAPILRSLPDWFGIEQAVAQYLLDIDRLPTLLAVEGDQVLGFLTLRQHNPYSAEIHVMGVRTEAHRQGIGRALVRRAEDGLRHNGVEYLQVKTLGPSRPGTHYAGTRAFYFAKGFRPLEELPELWNADNPCLIMVKKL